MNPEITEPGFAVVWQEGYTVAGIFGPIDADALQDWIDAYPDDDHDDVIGYSASELVIQLGEMLTRTDYVLDKEGNYHFPVNDPSMGEGYTPYRLTMVPAGNPWELEQRLCGYGADNLEGEYCFHEHCWEHREEIEIAVALISKGRESLAPWKLDPADDEPVRPERTADTYVVNIPVTPESTRIEEACMKAILTAFTDEEVRIIRDALEDRVDTPANVWLWSMFDSISVTEVKP